MSDVAVQALGIEESINAGFMPFTNSGSDVNDNPLVEALLTGNNAPRYDARGRLVISFRQYQELQLRDAQMGSYALEMTLPSKPHIRQLVPASKYLKYWGSGLEVVGAPLEETHIFADNLRRLRIRGVEQEEAIRQVKAAIAERDRVARAPTNVVDAPAVQNRKAFFCSDKYPECERFYDNQRGLSFHWRNDHGEAPITKAAKAKFGITSTNTEVEDEASSEE